MTEEQSKTLDAIKVAIQMEVDGKEFYTKAASQAANDLGKKLFTNLAAEEDTHRRVFMGIYDSIRDKKGWPEVDFHPDGGSALRTVFSQAMDKAAAGSQASATELEAVVAARAMEAKTYDFYHSHIASATQPAEKELYERLAAQEQEHNLILADYYEYLKDPAGWFVKKEHPSLD